jgi:hypothetical protein
MPKQVRNLVRSCVLAVVVSTRPRLQSMSMIASFSMFIVRRIGNMDVGGGEA